MKTFTEIHNIMFTEIYRSPEGWPEDLAQVDLFERAAKEYAKQWVEEAQHIVGRGDSDPAQKICDLLYQIDAQ